MTASTVSTSGLPTVSSSARRTLICGLCPAWCDDLPTAEAPHFASIRCSLLQQSAVALLSPTNSTASDSGNIDRAAELLYQAKRPLFWGMTQLTCEAQTAALELAEACGGAIIPAGESAHCRAPSVARQGETRGTRGEVSRYADLLIYVDSRPWNTRPRWFELLRLDKSRATPVAQILLSTDDQPAPHGVTTLTLPSSELALRLDEAVAETALRAALRLQSSSMRRIEQDSAWDELFSRWGAANYPVLIYDPGELAARHGARSAAIVADTAERWAGNTAVHRRAAAWPLPGIGNRPGWEYVALARSGYTSAIDFAGGTAQPLTNHSAAAEVTAGRTDLLVTIGKQPPGELIDAVGKAKIPWIAVGQDAAGQFSAARICLDTARFPQADSGTILRDDGVPLPLHPWINDSAPQSATLLRAWLTAFRALATTAGSV